MDGTVANANGHGFRTARCAEFLQYRGNMKFRGVNADAKFLSDLLVGESFANKLKDLAFSFGKRLQLM